MRLGVPVGVGVGPPLGVENELRPLMVFRFGSNQSQVKLGPICGNASAEIWMITPLVRRRSSRVWRTAGFCLRAVITAWSIRKTGAPFSDQPRSLSPSAAAWTAIGVAEGDGEITGDAPKLDGNETVPASLGVIVAVTLGIGVGVDVETSIGVGEAVGLSVGLGLCPNENRAMRNALNANPPASN